MAFCKTICLFTLVYIDFLTFPFQYQNRQSQMRANFYATFKLKSLNVFNLSSPNGILLKEKTNIYLDYNFTTSDFNVIDYFFPT